MKRLVATARVRVTIDIPIGDSWGPDCTVDQIHKQARESAVGILRGALVIEGLCREPHGKPRTEATIIGVPQVVCIFVEEK